MTNKSLYITVERSHAEWMQWAQQNQWFRNQNNAQASHEVVFRCTDNDTAVLIALECSKQYSDAKGKIICLNAMEWKNIKMRYGSKLEPVDKISG